MTTPLPTIEAVAEIITSHEYDNRHQRAQAIDALYRKHLVEWLRSDDVYMLLREAGRIDDSMTTLMDALAKAIESGDV